MNFYLWKILLLLIRGNSRKKGTFSRFNYPVEFIVYWIRKVFNLVILIRAFLIIEWLCIYDTDNLELINWLVICGLSSSGYLWCWCLKPSIISTILKILLFRVWYQNVTIYWIINRTHGRRITYYKK